MEQWLRDALAEEQGYIICPLAPETYTICNEKCEECEYMIDFMEALHEREGKTKNRRKQECFLRIHILFQNVSSNRIRWVPMIRWLKRVLQKAQSLSIDFAFPVKSTKILHKYPS